MFRAPRKVNDFDWTWTDHLLQDLPQIFGRNPDADVYDEYGQRVDEDGQPRKIVL